MPRPFTVLGLHFGHHAAAAVAQGGRIRSYMLRERLTPTKHALGLDLALINLALQTPT